MPGFCCCVGAFLSCGEQGLLSSGGAWPSHCGGFSGCRAQALRAQASVVKIAEYKRMDSAIVAHRFSCPKTCRILVPGPGIEPMSPALQGEFLTTGPQGKCST